MDSAGMQTVWAKMPLAEAVLQVFRYVGDDTRLQAIFDRERGRCYDDVIRFPDLVSLIADALLEHGGSGNQSFSRAQETGELKASKVAAYGKLGRLPIPLSEAFLAELTHELRELFPAQARRQSPVSLRGFNTITMDGKAIKNVAKRLKLLRRIGGGLLGGRALVAMHYETGLVIGMHADEDGDGDRRAADPALDSRTDSDRASRRRPCGDWLTRRPRRNTVFWGTRKRTCVTRRLYFVTIFVNRAATGWNL